MLRRNFQVFLPLTGYKRRDAHPARTGHVIATASDPAPFARWIPYVVIAATMARPEGALGIAFERRALHGAELHGFTARARMALSRCHSIRFSMIGSCERSVILSPLDAQRW